MAIATFYPRGFNPIHPVMSWSKVRSIVRSVRRGDEVPAVIVDGESMLNGTHRIAANNLLDMLANRAWNRDLAPETSDRVEVVQFEDLDLDEDTREACVEAMEDGDYAALDELLGDRDND